jgi:hypothetical protein
MLASRSYRGLTTSGTASMQHVSDVNGSATSYRQMALISTGGLQVQGLGPFSYTGARHCSSEDV